MIWWLEVETDPKLVFYRDPAALEHIGDYVSFRLLLGCGSIRNAIRIDGGGANPSVQIRLNNRSRWLTEVFEVPPYKKRANIMTTEGTDFSGTITSVTLGVDECTLNIEA